MSTGAMHFLMADVYGVGYSTTEETIPEAADQQALVDDQKAAVAVSDTGKKKFPVVLALALVVALAILFGGAK